MKLMTTPEQLQAILERIASQQQTAMDLEILRRSLLQKGTVLQWVSQDGKFNTNVGELRDSEVHIAASN
jgi:Effector-associated domain 10